MPHILVIVSGCFRVLVAIRLDSYLLAMYTVVCSTRCQRHGTSNTSIKIAYFSVRYYSRYDDMAPAFCSSGIQPHRR